MRFHREYLTRHDYAVHICNRLEQCKNELHQEFLKKNQINSCYIDNILDEVYAKEIYQSFPYTEELLLLKDIREYKYVGMQMNKYSPILEEIIYAFQEPRVVSLISEITSIEELLPDKHLYAGGISLMNKGCFLNPHLDNSHDKDRKNYRVLNLLYYVTPDWKQEYGGNLELWDQGLKKNCRTIHSKFNRLVIMITNKSSLHSVSKVNHQGQRCCVSNYYFSPKPVQSSEYFHVTSFRGRPEQRFRDIVLQGDAILRNGIRKIFKHGIKKPHYYQNVDSE
ncbi:2OG-Fe(II) oxygenase [Fischerella sp. JS2]|uniref:2OG-Fe(II) oxygenase n=1 Tax=Fischerella sp. JS2 TaxID=2597771 RepID=UPI0028E95514|nr:2OG-Fe(II) oxygenase [Fischerella sp. JS2]